MHASQISFLFNIIAEGQQKSLLVLFSFYIFIEFCFIFFSEELIMAKNDCLSQPMPLFIIDTCSSDDNPNSIKSPRKQVTRTISRWWSLPNCNDTYKDLCGAIHRSLSNRLKTLSKRSRSYQNNNLLDYLKAYERFFPNQSPSASIQLNPHRLDPNGGMQTPGGSSSRYSLYGSFFDLSESGYYPPSDQAHNKFDNRLLTIDGRPLLIIDQSTQLTTNTYQDKCTDWLRQMHTNSA